MMRMTEAAIQSESDNNADGPREPHLRQGQSYSTDAACGSHTSLRSVRLPHASIIRDNFDGRPRFSRPRFSANRISVGFSFKPLSHAVNSGSGLIKYKDRSSSFDYEHSNGL